MDCETITIGTQAFTVPYADLLPNLQDDEFEALREDIRKRGIIVPIVVDERRQVIDGQHRLRIALELGLPEDVVPFEIHAGLSDEAREDMAYSLNLCRRHLRPEQRRDVVARLREKRWSTTRIAEAIGVSEWTVREDLSGSRNLEPESPVTGQDGKSYPSTMPAPSQIAERRDRAQELREQGQSMPRIAQELGVSVGTVHADLRALTVVRASGAKEVGQASRVLDRVQDTPAGTFSVQELRRETGREIREQNRQERIAEIVSNSKPLESGVGTYPVILADPPWRYTHCEAPNRAIENQYPTMSLEDICSLPVGSVAGDNCILFCWATSPLLASAFQVLSAWGFTYHTNMVWVKDKIGMGYWARQRHELLLVATRGSIPTPPPEVRPDSVITAPRGRHSEKPVQAYEIIEAMFPDLPKLELFCRSPREGWAAWGNEA